MTDTLPTITAVNARLTLWRTPATDSFFYGLAAVDRPIQWVAVGTVPAVLRGSPVACDRPAYRAGLWRWVRPTDRVGGIVSRA